MTGFDDVFAAMFGGPSSTEKPKPEARPLPQIHGRRDPITGELWVLATDVADALESQAPKVNARLISKLRGSR